jgi:hypothetical protein
MEMVLASERCAERRSVFVQCQVIRKRDFILLGESAIDLSTSGMLLLSDIRATEGEEVFVVFRVPGTERWIDTDATIARRVRGRRSSDPGRGLGLKFAPLDSESERALRAVLEEHPFTLPMRAPRIDYAATTGMIALG